jgi:integrase/recombinase XerD
MVVKKKEKEKDIIIPQQPQQPQPQQQSPSSNEELLLQRKINLVTEGFMTITKSPEFILSDRNRLSAENALTVCNYLLDMKREINPKPSYVKSTIQILSELSRHAGITTKFMDMMTELGGNKDNIVLLYLDTCRKSENDDPLHRWVGTYNLKRIVLMRFFKWLYYPNIANPKTRDQLSTKERKPNCIMDIPQLKRREISCYKPSDLWTQEDDLLFLKWVTNKRDRCYHTMARDLSARPHEILNLKIKDIIFKTIGGDSNGNAGKKQYAEVLVNGKTGSRHIPLIQSIPYIKDWLADHPSRNNPNSPLFVGLGRRSMFGRRKLSPNGLYQIYRFYKNEFFPKLLKDSATVLSNEDRDKIKALLAKPFNPYIRRHSALTEKSVKIKSHTLNQHAGWSARSNMAQKYIHYFGNESSESLLEAYGIVTKNNIPIDTLNPKVCPNCNEGNTQDAKFCSKCRMIMSFEGYQEALESQKQKDTELQSMQSQLNTVQSMLENLLQNLGKTTDQNQANTLAASLFSSGVLKAKKSSSE